METIRLSQTSSLVLEEHLSPELTCRGYIIICPGGAYSHLSPREAEPIARSFRERGWKSAILYYSVREKPTDPALGKKPLLELGKAMSLIKEKSPDLPIAVIGFSAGAHLAASLGVHWKEEGLLKPDALILSYPVITAGAFAHKESIANLTEGDASYYSLENHVSADTPPTFLWHTAADAGVPVQNSLLFYERMLACGVKGELLIFPKGAHGLSLATPEVSEPEKNRYPDAHIARWFDQCVDWLEYTLG